MFFAFTLLAAGSCLPFTEAPKKIDETVCITGKVLHVGEAKRSGTHFLNFCADYRKCPFSVVVFARDLEKIGDLQALVGKEIEIHGKVQEYNGQAEIVLKDPDQLTGEISKLPPPPSQYDADRRGSASAGSPSKPQEKTARKRRNKKGGASESDSADPK
jgi:hypothetical protein